MSEERRHITDPVALDPSETVGHLDPDAEPSTATASELRYADIYGHMLLHRPEDLWVAPPGPLRALQNQIRVDLLSRRFSLDDADEWAYRRWPTHIAHIYGRRAPQDHATVAAKATEIALAYRDTGMPNDEAFAWATTPISAVHAVHYRNHGWHPHAYRSLTGLCIDGTNDEVRWVESPIVWWRALRYLRAGFGLEEALHHDRRHARREDADKAIDLLLGIRQEHDS